MYGQVTVGWGMSIYIIDKMASLCKFLTHFKRGKGYMIDRADEVYHVFQPVFSVKHEKAIGFEALLRHNDAIRPDDLFKMARERGCLYFLDALSINKAIETFHGQTDGYLFLNVFPSTLLASGFPQFLEETVSEYPIRTDEVVFEINETFIEEDVWNNPSFEKHIHLLRQQGFKVAFDDVGVGVASLKKIVEFQPDIIKLDRYFSTNLSRSEMKREIVNLSAAFCQSQNVMLILEGIENSDDFIAAKQMNVPYVQGYFTGEPLPSQHLEKVPTQNVDNC